MVLGCIFVVVVNPFRNAHTVLSSGPYRSVPWATCSPGTGSLTTRLMFVHLALRGHVILCLYREDLGFYCNLMMVLTESDLVFRHPFYKFCL